MYQGFAAYPSLYKEWIEKKADYHFQPYFQPSFSYCKAEFWKIVIEGRRQGKKKALGGARTFLGEVHSFKIYLTFIKYWLNID